MQLDLRGVRLAIIGGDAREVILAGHLAELGACINVFGLPVQGNNIKNTAKLIEAVDSVNAVILPVPGVSEELKLYSAYLENPVYITEEVFTSVPQGSPVLVGVARRSLKDLVNKMGFKLIEVLELDEVAILNSIPSAEGAIQKAMENMPITIHGCKAWVLGFGRTGMTLARTLAAMGAKTTVFARNPSQLARAMEMNLDIATYPQMRNYPGKVDVIFNTVPALVLNNNVLERLPTSVLIIDIASAPGGTDFETARKLGIKASLAPGLPGKVAPKTAGQILARVIPRLLAEELTLL